MLPLSFDSVQLKKQLWERARTGKERKHNSHLTNWCFPIHKQNITAIRSRRAQINRSIRSYRLLFYFFIFYLALYDLVDHSKRMKRSVPRIVVREQEWDSWERRGGRPFVALQSKWNHSKRSNVLSVVYYFSYVCEARHHRIDERQPKLPRHTHEKWKRNWMKQKKKKQNNRDKVKSRHGFSFVLWLRQSGVWLVTLVMAKFEANFFFIGSLFLRWDGVSYYDGSLL